MEFAEKLITLRKSRELTQEQLAEPVSYTHLDVYKRQAGGNAYYDGGAVLRIGRISITAFRTVV